MSGFNNSKSYYNSGSSARNYTASNIPASNQSNSAGYSHQMVHNGSYSGQPYYTMPMDYLKSLMKKAWSLSGLEEFFRWRWNTKLDNPGDIVLLREVLDREKAFNNHGRYESVILPGITKLAENVDVKILCTKFQSQDDVYLSRSQVAGILANAFLGLIPDLINFRSLFSSYYARNPENNKEKLKCLLHYLEYVVTHDKSPNANDVLHYRKHRVLSENQSYMAYLGTLDFVSGQSLFDAEMPQVDFANKRVGGGVLSNGALQEEIKFITCPELLLAKLFPGDMQDNEAIIVSGAHQYVDYEGYAESFKCLRKRKIPKDFKGAPVICIDATNFSALYNANQHDMYYVDREMTKAIAGFSGIKMQFDTIATGNWGGGCFKGDPVLKMKIQWLAASKCGKNLKYYTYTNTELEKKLLQERNKWRGKTIDELYEDLIKRSEVSIEQQRTTPLPLEQAQVLDGLDLLRNVMQQAEFSHIFSKTLNDIQSLANKLSVHESQRICTEFKSNELVQISRYQVAGILANAFLGKMPPGQDNSSINFKSLFNYQHDDHTQRNMKAEKIKCLLHYLNCVVSPESWNGKDEMLLYKKQKCAKNTKLREIKQSKSYLRDLQIVQSATSLASVVKPQVVFAKKKIGSGVFGSELYMEEIKLITCPELLLAKLFPGEMNDDEAIIVSGAHQYVRYEGYAGYFKCLGSLMPPKKFRDAPVIFIDATDFSQSPEKQRESPSVDREIIKAIAGFSGVDGSYFDIATGNWGCGRDKGDPVLKMKIQWIAASMCNKNLHYYLYKNVKPEERLAKEARKWRGKTIGELYKDMVKNYENYHDAGAGAGYPLQTSPNPTTQASRATSSPTSALMVNGQVQYCDPQLFAPQNQQVAHNQTYNHHHFHWQ